jgi:hypothetical protein
MPYTADELISNAFYLSKVVSRGTQVVCGDQSSEGLMLLNNLLGMKTANSRLIPYFNEYSLNLIYNTEKYFIPNLIEAETITFYLDTVRFSMLKQSRKRYFGTPRAENIQSLPYNWHTERCFGGSNLFIYFKPNVAYPMKIWGKFQLASVTQFQDLSLTLDPYYIEYLRYALAELICSEYGITMQPQAYEKLKEYEAMIADISPMDLSACKLSTLSGDSHINWGQVNIGRGYTYP